MLYCQCQNTKLYSIFVCKCVCGCVRMFLFHVADIRLRAASQIFVPQFAHQRSHHSVTSQSILRQVHSLSQSEFSQNHFILSSVFSAINCFTRQIVCNLWPIQLAFLPFIVFSVFFPPWFCIILHFPHDPSDWSPFSSSLTGPSSTV